MQTKIKLIGLVVGFLALGFLCAFWLTIPLATSNVSAQGLTVRNSVDRPVNIGVLGLFQPSEFVLSTANNSALLLQAGKEQIALERSSGLSSAHIGISEDSILLSAGNRTIRTKTIRVSGRESEPVEFVLAIPHKIRRQYRGTLDIEIERGHLLATIRMNLESAVASVVAAENLPDTPIEALKAQSIVARSYFIAGRGRHQGFDFCDTTHCQFMRQQPAPTSPMAKAVEATRGLVLIYQSHPFAAMYTRSCGGRTRTPAELGFTSVSYPYYPAECKYCSAHPVHWSSRISVADSATLHNSNELERLKLVRRLGWDTIPSNDFVIRIEGNQAVLNGVGQGHGVGMCQSGAKFMAQNGATAREILQHYYPNAEIAVLDGSTLAVR